MWETLEVLLLADHEPALALYQSMGFEELDPPPPMLPRWMRGALFMGKGL